MRKKIVIIVCMILISTVMLVPISMAKTKVEEKNYKLILKDKETEISQYDQYDIKEIYNTLFINMDNILDLLIKNEYKSNTNQEINYNNQKISIDIDKNIINYEIISEDNDNNRFDNSVDVEIETIDNQKYIPLYLLTSLPGVKIKIDGIEIYDSAEYHNSLDAINSDINSHNIELSYNNDENKSVRYTYVGEEDGALWREEAYKRIEKYRKKDVSIIVKNKKNKVIKNATVDISMINNDFKFGTAIRKNNMPENYKLKFNQILDGDSFKWKNYLGDDKVYADAIYNYGIENNLYMRGHFLWRDAVEEELATVVGDKNNPAEDCMIDVYNKYTSGQLTNDELEVKIANLEKQVEEISLEHIKKELTLYPEIHEWDVVNSIMLNQYFKHYLYERHFLTDNSFINKTTYSDYSSTDNEEYIKLLAKCFDTARQYSNAKLDININRIYGIIDDSNVNNIIDLINKIKQHTNNLNLMGVQSHIANRYSHTPQAYYNQINYVLENTNIEKAIITEFDNFVNGKMFNYNEIEKNLKARYLKDSLIEAYSNKNMDGFCLWVYNSDEGIKENFVDEERLEYDNLMKEWLNYTSTQYINEENSKINTSLYKGEYKANIKVNDIEKEVEFSVNDESDGQIEITIDNSIERIEIKNKPKKLDYIQNFEKLDVRDATIVAYYNDSTKDEISLTSSEIKVVGFDNSKLGYQTIYVTYQNKKTCFVVKIMPKSIVKMELINKPTKLIYSVGENIDLSNGIVRVSYNDNTYQDMYITMPEFKYSGFNSNKKGRQNIMISYLGFSVNYDVEIVEKVPEIKKAEKLQIKSMPYSTKVIQKNGKLDLTGGVINVTYIDGTKEEIPMTSPEVTVEGLDITKLGKQIVKLKYREAEIEFEITVVEKQVESVEIEKEPSKENDGIIKVDYDDGTTEKIKFDDKDVTVKPIDNTVKGEQAVKVLYSSKEASYVVKVGNDKTTADGIIPQTGQKLKTFTIITAIVAIIIFGGKYIYIKRFIEGK